MKVTQLSDLGVTDNKDLICQKLIDELSEIMSRGFPRQIGVAKTSKIQ